MITTAKEKKYWKSITLTEVNLLVLEKILLKYCDKVTYCVYTDNSTEEKVFQTAKDLAHWNSPDNDRIFILEIYGTYKNAAALEVTFHRFLFEIPFKGRRPFAYKCQYSNKEIVKRFNKDMEAFGNQEEELYSKQFKSSMTKRIVWAFFVLVDLLGAIYLFSPKNTQFSEMLRNATEELRENSWSYTFKALCLLLLIKAIEYYLVRPLFRALLCPTVNFAWGIEKQRYERRTRVRHNLFWGVLTAFGVSLVASFLSPYFKDFIIWIHTLFEPIPS